MLSTRGVYLAASLHQRRLPCREHSRRTGVECVFEGIASVISSHDSVEPHTSANSSPSDLQARDLF